MAGFPSESGRDVQEHRPTGDGRVVNMSAGHLNGYPYADLALYLGTSTLAGYDGSPVAIPTDVMFANYPNVYVEASGTLEPVAGVSVTPEPASLLLLATGLLGCAAMWRKRLAA